MPSKDPHERERKAEAGSVAEDRAERTGKKKARGEGGEAQEQPETKRKRGRPPKAKVDSNEQGGTAALPVRTRVKKSGPAKAPKNEEMSDGREDEDVQREAEEAPAIEGEGGKEDNRLHVEWKEGDPVPFSHLSSTLDRIQSTSKRLEIVSILTAALSSVRRLTPEDLVAFIYIILGRVAPPFKGLELGVGDSVLVQAVAAASGHDVSKIKEEYKKVGDLGKVAVATR
eukprot:747660-Hanusia_phi.AAC.3